MKRKKYLKILLVIVTLVLLIIFCTRVFVEPWIGKKIQTALNEKNRGYIVKIDKVHILIFKAGIELETITISSIRDTGGDLDLNGKIASIKFKGIRAAKALFKKNIDISSVTISNSSIKVKIPISGKAKPAIVSPLNIRIGRIFIDKTDLTIQSTSTAQSYLVKEGVLKVYDLQVEKKDILSTSIVKQFDFEAKELASVSSDSMYSFIAGGINYSATLNTLAINSFSIHPNYTDYDFTSRHKFQTTRIEAGFSDIYFHDFYAADYFRNKNVISSYEVNTLNPILGKNAFIYVTSGKIDAMNFGFTANNSRATGKMTMLYHGLEITVKNKRTDDTTAFNEKFISLIANIKILDPNPISREGVREGIIDYERDPERFLFGYWFKSIMSGLKSSLTNSPKNKKDP